MIIVNIAETLLINDQQVGKDADASFMAAKEILKKDLQLVLLAPFGLINGDVENDDLISPALAKIVLEKFPALPRLLKKLAGKIDADTTSRLMASVKDKGEKPGRVAKDFLVSKKLI